MKVLITREQHDDSPFFKIVQPTGFTVVGRSLLTFSPVHFSEIPETDWIFFYSKNAVSFFLKQAAHLQWQPLPQLKFAAIGQATADMLEEEGIIPRFIGNGQPEATATQFLPLAQHQSVLFPRAKHSKQSIQKILANAIQSMDLIVYENQKNCPINLPDFDVLVFTSPLNAAAYFDKYIFKKHQKVVAIGTTTSSWLSLNNIPHRVADRPNEESMAMEVLKIASQL